MFNDDAYVKLVLFYLHYGLSPPNTFSKLAVSQCKCLITTSTLISSSFIYSMHCLLPTHSQSCLPMQMFNEDDVYVDLLLCCLLYELSPPNLFSKLIPMQIFNEDDVYVGLLSLISLCHKAFAKMAMDISSGGT
jgi:hypothetical protein